MGWASRLLLNKTPDTILQLNHPVLLEMLLSRPNRMLPLFAKIPSVYHSVHTVITQVRVNPLNRLMELLSGHHPSLQKVKGRFGENRM